MHKFKKYFQPIKKIIIYFLIWNLAFPVNYAFTSGIEVDPNNPETNTPTVDQAQNGVPIVNLASPSRGGLSANKFKDYNVDRQGVILNNSLNEATRSQLGGVLGRNPNFKAEDRAASLVMFEVTGANQSNLNGYTEMFGQSAEFILANPNGIYVNGAGFINIPRATLTTGKPQMDENGNLTHFDVNNGNVVIEGLGLNVSSVDYFDIVARTAQINAAIWATANSQELGIITGRNNYNYQDRTYLAKEDDAVNKPQFAIDASALGSMYANSIKLVSTEQGVGVNTESGILACAGDVEILAEGDISFKSIAANQSIKINSSESVRQTEKAYAKDKIIINAGKDIDLKGNYTQANNKILLNAAGDINLEKTINKNNGQAFLSTSETEFNSGNNININDADMYISGTASFNANQNITISESIIDADSQQIKAVGTVTANQSELYSRNGDLKIEAANLANTEAVLVASKNILVNLSGKMTNDASLMQAANSNINIKAGDLENKNDTILLAVGKFIVNADGSIINKVSTILAGDNIEINSDLTDGSISNTGKIKSNKDIVMNSDSINNAGEIIADGSISLTSTGGDIDNQGYIEANSPLNFNSNKNINNNGLLFSGSTIQLFANNAVTNDQGQILAKGLISVNAMGEPLTWDLSSIGRTEPGFYNNSGIIRSGDSIVVNSKSYIYNTGGSELIAAKDIIAYAPNSITNSDSLIWAGNNINLGNKFSILSEFINNGEISAKGRIDLMANTINNTGSMAAEKELFVTAENGSLNNTGSMEANTTVNIQVSDSIDNYGTIFGYAGARLNAGNTISNTGGLIQTKGDLLLTASNSILNSGTIWANKNLVVTSNSAINNQKSMVALGDMYLESQSINNAYTYDSNNYLSGLVSGGKLNIIAMNAWDINNESGYIFSNNDMSVIGGNLINTNGKIEGLNSMDLALSNSLDNRDGIIKSGKYLTINTLNHIYNNNGLIQAKEQLALTAAQIDNSNTAAVDVSGNYLQGLQAGGIYINQTTTPIQNGLSNINGTIIGDVLNLKIATDIDNTNGLILANADITLNPSEIKARNIINQNGLIGAEHRMVITADSIDNTNTGNIGSNSHLTINTNAFDNSYGMVSALGDLRIANVNNENGWLEAGSSLFITEDDGIFTNTNGNVISFGTGTVNISVDNNIENDGGQILSNNGIDLDVRNHWDLRGTIMANGNIDIDADSLTNYGLVQTENGVSFHTNSDFINNNIIKSNNSLAINSGQDLLNYGQINSTGKMNLYVADDLINYADAEIKSGDNLNIIVGDITDNYGHISSSEKMDFESRLLRNYSGQIAAGVTLNVNAYDINNDSVIFSGDDMRLKVAHNLTNQGFLLSSGDMTVQKKDGKRINLFQNNQGGVEADGKLTIRANSIENLGTLTEKTITNLNNHSGAPANYYEIDNSSNPDQVGDKIYKYSLTSYKDKQSINRAYLGSGDDMVLDGNVRNILSSIYSGSNIYVFENLDNSSHDYIANYSVEDWEYVEYRYISGSYPCGGYNTCASFSTDYKWEKQDTYSSNQIWKKESAVVQAEGNINISGSVNNTGTSDSIREGRTYNQKYDDKNENLPNNYSIDDGTIDLTKNLELPADNGLFKINDPEALNNIPDTGQITITDQVLDFSDYAGSTDSIASRLKERQDNTPEIIKEEVITFAAPKFRYLVETNIEYLDMDKFIGSEYFLERMNFNADETAITLLGDAYYETLLIKDTIMEMSNSRYLSEQYTSDYQQIKDLYDNAVDISGAMDLTVGQDLTQDQIDALERDIIWLVETDINGEIVLAPKIFLSKETQEYLAERQDVGSVISGYDISIDSDDTITNTGLIQARSSIFINAEGLDNSGLFQSMNCIDLNLDDQLNNSGQIESDVLLVEASDVYNSGDIISGYTDISVQNYLENNGYIKSDSLIVDAGNITNEGSIAGNLIFLTAVNDLVNLGGNITADEAMWLKTIKGDIVNESVVFQSNDNDIQSTQISAIGTIQSGGFLSINSAMDFLNKGAKLSAGTDALINAAKDIKIESIFLSQQYSENDSDLKESSHFGSMLTIGGNLSMDSGRDITVFASGLNVDGAASISADRDFNILAGTNSVSKTGSEENEKNITHTMSNLNIGGDLFAESGRNTVISGSMLNTGGNGVIIAGNDLTIQAVQNVHTSSQEEGKNSIRETSTLSSGLNIGANLAMKSGNDTNIIGSNINVNESASITAGNNFNLLSDTNTYTEKHEEDKKTSYMQTKQNVASNLNVGSDMLIQSDGDMNFMGSNVNVDGSALMNSKGDINILAGEESTYKESAKEKKGFFSSSTEHKVSATKTYVGSNINTGGALTIVAEGEVLAQAANLTGEEGVNIDAQEGISVLSAENQSYSYKETQKKNWFSDKKTEDESLDLTHDGSAIASQETISLNTDGGSITVGGSEIISGGDTYLTAANDINIISVADSSTKRHYEKEMSLDGVSISNTRSSASLNFHQSGTSTEQEEINITQKGSNVITGGNFITQSGGDTNVLGSDVLAGGSVLMKADGDMNILSAEEMQETIETNQEIKNTVSLTAGNAWADSAMALGESAKNVIETEQKNDGSTAGHANASSAKAQAAIDAAETSKLAINTARSGTTAGTYGFYGSVSTTQEINEKENKTTAVSGKGSSIVSLGGDVSLEAGNKLNITGSNVSSWTGDILLAADEVNIKAAANTLSSETNASSVATTTELMNSSGIVSLPTVSQAGSQSWSKDTTYTNSGIAAENGKITIKSKNDTNVEGANIIGKTVDTDIGGKLNVKSLQDTHESSAEATGVSYGNVNGFSRSESESDKAWVSQQTTIIGTEKVNINADQLHLEGGAIANVKEDGTDGGNLNLNVNKISYNDIQDKDYSYSEAYGFSTSLDKEGKDDGLSSLDWRGGETSGSYSNSGHNKEQITKATLGQGTIETQSDISGINRDVDKAQEIIKDEKLGGYNISLTAENDLITDSLSNKSGDTVVNKQTFDENQKTDEKKYTVYIDSSTGSDGNNKYIGMTTKDGNHDNSLQTNNEDAAIGMKHILIEMNGGARSQDGTLQNKNRAIDPNNQERFERSINAAKQEFSDHPAVQEYFNKQ